MGGRFSTLSLKYRMLLACVLCTAIVLVFVIGILMNIFNGLTLRATIQASQWNLQMATEGMERIFSDIRNMANWTAGNPRVRSFVTSTDPEVIRRLQLETARLVIDRLSSSISGQYIDKLIIASENGSFIEQGLTYGIADDVRVASSMPFFARKLKEDNGLPDVLHTARFPFAVETQALPIVRRIDSGVPGSPQGWTYISVSHRAVNDSFTRFTYAERSEVFIRIGDELWEFSPGAPLQPARFKSDLIPILDDLGPAESWKRVFLDRKQYTAVIHRSAPLGWTLVEVFGSPLGDLGSTDYLTLLLIVASAILLLAVVIITLMNRMVNKPIRKIIGQLDAISAGNFTPNVEIESEDEIGRIGVGINRMARHVRRLIDQRIADEKQRKILELNMLQSQINPHFLYNTLNSIKWMADMQKAKGISSTVSSLAALLKEIAKGTDEIITVKDELELLKKYVELERTISGNLHTVTYDLPDPDVLGCRIIKFTLQPVVENALFHGLAPKETGGSVVVAIRRIEDGLGIQVRDDGIGMTEEQLAGLLDSKGRSKGKFNRIGLHNVDERIKLTFGAAYGVKVESAVGAGTTVHIRLPYLRIEEESHV